MHFFICSEGYPEQPLKAKSVNGANVGREWRTYRNEHSTKLSHDKSGTALETTHNSKPTRTHLASGGGRPLCLTIIRALNLNQQSIKDFKLTSDQTHRSHNGCVHTAMTIPTPIPKNDSPVICVLKPWTFPNIIGKA